MELKINLDPANPGQFFACCGLLALIESQNIATKSRFNESDTSARQASFMVNCDDVDLPALLEKLRLSNVISAQDSSSEELSLGHIEESIEPVLVTAGLQQWRFDWWLTEFGDESTELKCWAGQVKSAVLTSELFRLLDSTAAVSSLFDHAVMAKAKFGIDPRSAWNALDFGYSPNEHGKDAATYPMVEVLGCFGLQSLKPTVLRGRRVRYSLWRQNLPFSVARLAALMPWSGLDSTHYEFSIDKRGQSYKFFSTSRKA